MAVLLNDPGRQAVYERFSSMEPGEMLSHDELLSLLDTDDMHRVYKVVGFVARRLRRHHRRTLGCVRGTGYRVLYANEHDEQAASYEDSGRRKFHTAMDVLRSTRTEELNPKERERHDAGVMVLAMLQLQIDGLDRRLRIIERGDESGTA
jgi:hypothetical protein